MERSANSQAERTSLDTKEMKMSRGFTLIELLVAMTVMTIVLGATVSFFILENRSTAVQEQRIELMQKAQSTLNFMIDDLRAIGYDPNETGTFLITYADSNRLGFAAPVLDSTGDPMLDTVTGSPVATAATWQLQNDTLIRTGQVVSTDVERIRFDYLDVSGDTMAFPISAIELDSIRDANIVLTFRNPRGRYSDFRYTVRGYVKLRNR
jgi:prepilin-type N-terminal cleavage/methylation domain-containing protein